MAALNEKTGPDRFETEKRIADFLHTVILIAR